MLRGGKGGLLFEAVDNEVDRSLRDRAFGSINHNHTVLAAITCTLVHIHTATVERQPTTTTRG